jgi:hypothetical protein
MTYLKKETKDFEEADRRQVEDTTGEKQADIQPKKKKKAQ